MNHVNRTMLSVSYVCLVFSLSSLMSLMLGLCLGLDHSLFFISIQGHNCFNPHLSGSLAKRSTDAVRGAWLSAVWTGVFSYNRLTPNANPGKQCHQLCQIRFQSNGVLVDDDWCKSYQSWWMSMTLIATQSMSSMAT